MSHCASFLCLNGLSRVSFTHAEHLTADDGTLELAEICCQQSKRTHTQPEIRCQRPLWTQIRGEICCQQSKRTHTQTEIPSQQLTRTRKQPEISCQQPLWMQTQAEILSQQLTRTHTQAEIPSPRPTRTQTQGEISCQQLARTQIQAEIVAARCAAYRVFLRKTREGSWESAKTAIFIRFAYNRRRGRRKKIDIRSMA